MSAKSLHVKDGMTDVDIMKSNVYDLQRQLQEQYKKNEQLRNENENLKRQLQIKSEVKKVPRSSVGLEQLSSKQ